MKDKLKNLCYVVMNLLRFSVYLAM